MQELILYGQNLLEAKTMVVVEDKVKSRPRTMLPYYSLWRPWHVIYIRFGKPSARSGQLQETSALTTTVVVGPISLYLKTPDALSRW